MKPLEFNKIVTCENFLTIGEKDVENLITIANHEVNRFRISNPYLKLNGEKEKARTIVNTGLCTNFNDIEKELMATSIAYEDEKIIKVLIKSNIYFEHIQGLCENLSKFKKMYLKNPNDRFFYSKHYMNVENALNKICFLINYSLVPQDDYLIINKLMYIVAYKKDLYLKLEGQKIKKPQ